MSHVRLAAALVAASMAYGCATRTTLAAPDAAADTELLHIKDAVEAVLSSPAPRGYAIPDGVRLLSLSRRGTAVVLDLSGEILAAGTGPEFEDAVHLILTAASNARAAGGVARHEYTVLIDGIPLEAHVR